MELARDVGGAIAGVSALVALISFILCLVGKPQPIRTLMVSAVVMVVSFIGTAVLAQILLSRTH